VLPRLRGFPDRLLVPEILVRVRDGKVTIRPIAGTRPRGATPAEDRAHAESLLADPKERAEHLMLLDLGRNDVGRVSELGSVAVTDSFFLEYYSQVMHIVSNVEGRLDPRFDALDALVAGFPAGTVSGAPKVRAMEIIDELEKEKRGPYAGCIGYFGANGEMDTCIVLRTAVVKDGRMAVQAGAGIVYDSDPASEQQECVNKAKASSAPPRTRSVSPAAPGSGSRAPVPPLPWRERETPSPDPLLQPSREILDELPGRAARAGAAGRGPFERLGPDPVPLGLDPEMLHIGEDHARGTRPGCTCGSRARGRSGRTGTPSPPRPRPG
jgi:hypothetical protein